MTTRIAASRFLMQATLGANNETINDVKNQGIEAWLDGQLNNQWQESDSFYKKTKSIWRGKTGNSGFRKLLKDHYGENNINGQGNNPALPYKYYFRMAWWHRSLVHGNPSHLSTASDEITETEKISALEASNDSLVRHRIAQALSEILVVSDNSILELNAEAIADYYDLLYKHAFGSYQALLEEVSLHPCMGVYLTHINNKKSDPANNIHPDENYARELMQLFSIGLYELEPDGQRKQHNNRDIPSYKNSDVKEMARVFTGIKATQYLYEWPNAKVGDKGSEITFSNLEKRPIELADSVSKTFKMIPYVNMLSKLTEDAKFRDTGNKSLLKGKINLNANNLADEVKQVTTQLVAHPNTAPFIAKKLIQQLVTSNPTPDYIQAVASKFGSTGNLKETVREILTYPLHNSVTLSNTPKIGNIQKLKSPVLRITQLLRAFKVTNDSKRLWLIGDDLKDSMNQHPLSSPTVFNFYKSDFSPHGQIEKDNKVAPEFELLNASTSISYVNMLYDWLFADALPLASDTIKAGANPPHVVPELDHQVLLSDTSLTKLRFDFTEEIKLAKNSNDFLALITRISTLLIAKETPNNVQDILTTISKYDPTKPIQQKWIVQTIVFMIAISPEFVILELTHD